MRASTLFFLAIFICLLSVFAYANMSQVGIRRRLTFRTTTLEPAPAHRGKRNAGGSADGVTSVRCPSFNKVCSDACEPSHSQNGCKIRGTDCVCGYGCKTEYIYRTRRLCANALRERNTNICFKLPCKRGICTQTILDPGFDCKCDGTGFYGRRCENVCPSIPRTSLIYPHECIVI